MSYRRRWGSSSLPYVTLLSPGAGTAGWQSHQGGTWHLLGSPGWKGACRQQQAAGQLQSRVGQPRHGLLAATKESSSFQGLCFLSPAFSICQGRLGPGLTPAMKASRQDVPPSLPALLLPGVPRRYGKEQPCSNCDPLGSLQVLPRHGDGSLRREPGGCWDTDGPSPDPGDSGYGDMVWSPRSALLSTAHLQWDPAP